MRVNSKPKKEVVPQNKPTIHNVFLLDRSGSMADDNKYSVAVEGLNMELSELKKDTNANYTQTIVEFDTPGKDITHCLMTPLNNVPTFKGNGPRGMTALYDAIGNIIELLILSAPKDDKILLKIFTDGEENSSVSKYRHPSVLRELIKNAEKDHNFTVTFEGTKFDIDNIVRTVGISRSNTLSHDNTSAGIKMSVKSRIGATFTYSKAIIDGEDVTTNFYSKSVE